MGLYFNDKCQTGFRKSLQNNMPEPERILWNYLRGSQLHGHKFRRQHGILKYVVDFYCPKINLAIEIDGESHFLSPEAIIKDRERQKELEKIGVKVLRLTNRDVMDNIQGVLEKIENVIGVI